MERPPATVRIEELLAHREWVRRMARALVQDDARADDLEQEVWTSALERPPAERGLPLRGWLATVLRFKAIDQQRSEARRRIREEAVAREERQPSADEVVARGEILKRVVVAVMDLHEPYRSAVLLRYFEGLSPPVIAVQLELPLETVRTRLRRALALLRERLDEDHRGDRRKWALLLLPLGRRTAPAGTGLGLTAGILGGIAMTLKAKAVAAAAFAVVLVLLGGGFWWSRSGDGPRARGDPSPTARSAEVPPPVAAASKEPGAPAPAADPRNALRGQVQDPGGRPVAGARVLAAPGNASSIVESGTGSHEGGTDAEGHFAVQAPSQAPFFDLLVTARGFAPAHVQRAKVGEEVSVRLEKEVVLAGKVLDRQGRPVPGARVRVQGMAGLVLLTREALADTSGEYRVEGLAADMAPELGLFLYEVAAKGFATLVQPGRGSLRADADGVAWRDFTLGRGGAIRGTVVDALGGGPVAGARVALWSYEALTAVMRAGGAPILNPYGFRVLAETKSGTDGSFRLEGAPSVGSYAVDDQIQLEVGAFADGFAPEVHLVPRPEEGSEVASTLRLHPSARVSGRVTGLDGIPVPGAWVSAEPVAPAFPLSSVAVFPASLGSVPGSGGRTDAQGHYLLPAVAVDGRPKGRIRVKAWRHGDPGWGNRADAEVEIDASCGEENRAPDLVLPADPCGYCTVTVTDGEGRPVWGAIAVLVGLPGPGWLTDHDGRAVVSWWKDIRNSPPDPRLMVQARGFAPAVLPLPLDGGKEGLRAVLRPGTRLAGRVVEADGGPAAGADVQAVDASASADTLLDGSASPYYFAPGRPILTVYGRTTVTADGSFVLEDLPAEPVHLLASRRVRFPVRSGSGDTVRAVAPAVEPGRQDLQFSLPPDGGLPVGTVEVQVLDATTSRPVPAVSAYLGRDGKWESPVDAGSRVGRFVFEVPEGIWTLRAVAHGYATASVEGIRVRAGETTTMPPVSLQRGATLVGRLIAPAGIDMEGRSVKIVPCGPDSGRGSLVEAPVDRDGSFRATGLLPGPWRIEIVGFPVLAAEDGGRFEIRAEQPEVRREWTVARAASLFVTFEGDRVPATGLRIEVLNEGGGVLLDERWDPGPKTRPFGVRFLLPGSVLLRVVLPDGQTREQRVLLEEGKMASPVFRLP